MIFQASWLATVARKELLRFKEFMKWIRYGTCATRISTVRRHICDEQRPAGQTQPGTTTMRAPNTTSSR